MEENNKSEVASLSNYAKGSTSNIPWVGIWVVVAILVIASGVGYICYNAGFETAAQRDKANYDQLKVQKDFADSQVKELQAKLDAYSAKPQAEAKPKAAGKSHSRKKR